MKGNADQRLDQTPRRFTALSGVFGGGSTGLANQPPHPQWRELAELLLDCGANPADEEALAINQDASLEILLRHGLKPDDLATSGISLRGRALSQAARSGNGDQVRLLLAHHARTDERFNGRLPWDHATRLGRVEIARLLEQAGAPVAQMDEVGQFVAHCMAGAADAARAMLDRTPDLMARAPRDMVSRAVWTKRREAVEVVLELGFDPNWIEDNAAVHQTGVLAEHEEILQLLLKHGASLKVRDPWYDGTAIGSADFFNAIALRAGCSTRPTSASLTSSTMAALTACQTSWRETPRPWSGRLPNTSRGNPNRTTGRRLWRGWLLAAMPMLWASC